MPPPYNCIAKFFPSNVAVNIFFIISVFLITNSYEHTSSLIFFYKKRVKRIIPAYWTIIFLSVFVLSFASTLSIREYFTSVSTHKYLFWNILTLGFMCPDLPGVFETNPWFSEVNGSLWTVKNEVLFYLFLPVLLSCLKNRTIKTKNCVFIILFISAFIYRFLCNWIAKLVNIPAIGRFAMQFPGYLNYFISGVFLYYNFDLIRKLEKYLIVPSIIVVVVYFIFAIELSLAPALMVLLCFTAFHFSYMNKLALKNDYSYGIYLVHAPIVQLCVQYKFYECNTPLTIFLILGSSFFLAYLSWHFIEKIFLEKRI